MGNLVILDFFFKNVITTCWKTTFPSRRFHVGKCPQKHDTLQIQDYSSIMFYPTFSSMIFPAN